MSRAVFGTETELSAKSPQRHQNAAVQVDSVYYRTLTTYCGSSNANPIVFVGILRLLAEDTAVVVDDMERERKLG
ncbi:hypothetical protein L916_00677 [Phytophthora nicotianae]|uniref:Uncharacterized protein n=1 Tax=Phytophthora nicotianae TaxID=4792 RepID=W2JUF3_PHYNI|nr:hypothetical protein L916_00677 [Phytophthora nicotianae]